MRKRHILSIIVAAAILLYLFTRVDINKTIEVLQNVNQTYIILASIVSIIVLFIRVAVWGLFLEPYRIGVQKSHLVSTFMASQFLANVTPGRVGDLVRPMFLKRWYGTSFFKVLPSLIVERFLDVAILLLFSESLILSYAVGLNQLLTTVATFSIILIAVGLVIIFKKGLLGKALDFTLSLFRSFGWSSRLRRNIEELVDNFYLGIETLKSARLIEIVGSVFFGWVLYGIILYLSALALVPASQLPSLFAVTGFMALAVLGGTLSSLPGGFGSIDAIVFFLFVASGISEPTSLSIAVVYRFTSYIIPIIFSSIFFYMEVRH